MNKILVGLLNIVFFGLAVLAAFIIADYALVKKIDDYHADTNNSIRTTVVKQEIPVVAATRGIITKLPVKEGQTVRKGDTLLEVDNTAIRTKIESLEAQSDSESAQTELELAKQELTRGKITAASDGVVGNIGVAVGSPVDNQTKVMVLYSHDNIRAVAAMDPKQYQEVSKKKQLLVSSERLNRDFIVKPETLRPEEKVVRSQNGRAEKKVEFYLSFADSADAAELLDNEGVTMQLHTQKGSMTDVSDIFSEYWGSLFAKQ
jgi:multidrug efflux pump subunit AcrA (membrane-fusion protein)